MLEQEINSLTPFSTALYPSALALISPTGLQIGRIRSIQHVDIRTIPLEEDEPRRIAHDPQSKTFGVVCARRDVNRVTGEQKVAGMIQILDDQTFKGMFRSSSARLPCSYQKADSHSFSSGKGSLTIK